jgi:hypothetical protein
VIESRVDEPKVADHENDLATDLRENRLMENFLFWEEYPGKGESMWIGTQRSRLWLNGERLIAEITDADGGGVLLTLDPPFASVDGSTESGIYRTRQSALKRANEFAIRILSPARFLTEKEFAIAFPPDSES